MTARKPEAITLRDAARLLGCTDRKVAGLIRQGKLDAAPMPPPHTGRGRPPLLVSRNSLEEYARFEHIILHEIKAEEVRGRHAGLSRWLNQQTKLKARLERARITEIDGQGAAGKVWVRFLASPTLRRTLLTQFWRQDAGGLFGARKFRLEIEDQRLHLYLRGQDEELDRLDLERCIAAAIAAVAREEGRLKAAAKARA